MCLKEVLPQCKYIQDMLIFPKKSLVRLFLNSKSMTIYIITASNMNIYVDLRGLQLGAALGVRGAYGS